MFFKRIEMTGFKSFATKTTVDFLPGVTVVVGPNGCGKSNIFDAIRWVLGEQSAKSLRGSKMGDVIFAGSATFKPMGCAQVTLVVNNENGRLPIDYSEVSITRRLYRSGESEYLLNKVPCRLRDIQELFLDTGIGTESYSIMEQGRVDEIVRSKPEERRHLFEEAAGISKYKTRKTEALRKLERTEQDLVRLADRIGECRTRCISLKRQAAKAERYKGLKESADAVEIKLLAMRLTQLDADLGRIEKTFQAANDRMLAARAQTDVAQARREELQVRIELADQTLQDLITRKEDQRQYINDCANEITRLRGLADGERRRAESIARQISDDGVRRDELAVNLAEANADEARLAMKAIRLQVEQNLRKAEYERMRADSDATLSEIRSLRKSLEEQTEAILRRENERNRLQLQMEQCQTTIREFEEKRLQHQAALDQLAADIDRRRETLDFRQQEVKRVEAELAALKEKAMGLLKRRESLREEHRTTEQKLNEARSRLGALERLAREYEGFFAGVKAVMLASEDRTLTGIVGAVPDLIQALSPDHDLAIEVALGNHVQDIVVRTADAGKEAIHFLKESRRGRATFLPLDLIEASEPGPEGRSVLSRPGVVGLASKLVAYDRDIEPIVLNLLGRTIVTETLDVALDLTRAGLRQRYVSLDGQLTFPSGAITGGSRQISAVMSRRREITDLTAQTRDFETHEADVARRLAGVEKEIAEAESRGAQLREKLGDLRLELGRGETELAALRDNRRQRGETFAEMEVRAESSRENSDQFGVQIEAAGRDLRDLEEKVSAQRSRLAEMEQVLFGRNEEVDQLGSNVNQADQEIMRLAERRAYLRENAATYHGEIQSLQRRIAQLRNERETALREGVAHDEQADRLREEKAALEREIAGIDEKCREAARTKDEAQIAIHSENERVGVLMRELNEATNALNEIQTDLVRAQEDKRHLAQTTRERFDRSLEDLLRDAGEVEESREQLDEELERLRDDLRKMGDNINMYALIEYREENERFEFLTTQERDLLAARDSLHETIDTVDNTIREIFSTAFEQIRRNFQEVYRQLFGGGKADLILQQPEEGDPLLDGGIEILVQPPGKKLQHISLLSGGEKALTAVSLMFAIFMYKPSPFCVMDEIDAPLDDTNVVRFSEMLREFAQRSQFIIITHNKITMNLADTLYGITMQETGVSSLVSVSFDQLDKIHAGVS